MYVVVPSLIVSSAFRLTVETVSFAATQLPSTEPAATFATVTLLIFAPVVSPPRSKLVTFRPSVGSVSVIA